MSHYFNYIKTKIKILFSQLITLLVSFILLLPICLLLSKMHCSYTNIFLGIITVPEVWKHSDCNVSLNGKQCEFPSYLLNSIFYLRIFIYAYLSIWFISFLKRCQYSSNANIQDNVLRLIPYILEQYAYIERTKPV